MVNWNDIEVARQRERMARHDADQNNLRATEGNFRQRAMNEVMIQTRLSVFEVSNHIGLSGAMNRIRTK